MAVVMCFGDSNTHGTPPIVDVSRYDRFAKGIRWPTLLKAAEVIEEGLPGRVTAQDDPIMGAHMNGQIGLKAALESHGPIDILIIMLSTNDVKARFNATAETVACGIASLLDIAQQPTLQTRHGSFKILLICPPPVVEVGVLKGEFYGANARSTALPKLLKPLAQARGVEFLDAGSEIQVSPIDGVHFEADAHSKLAAAVNLKLATMS